jgi:hypothetical protein
MQHFIQNDLHAHSLVVGSASGFSPWIVQSKLDVVDAHSYWQHPHFPHKPWDPNDWTVKNIPITDEPDGGVLATLALRRVAGKPFIVTEYNASAPNTYSSEAFLELCAVAALQDWDGVFVFAYSHRLNDWDTRHITSFFDIDQHPTKMATLPAALALFIRGDIQPALHRTATVEVPAAIALESVRTKGSWVDAGAYGMPRQWTVTLPMGMRISDPGSTRTSLVGDISSHGGEGALFWNPTTHIVTIMAPSMKAPRSVGIIGSVRPRGGIQLGKINITPGATLQNWATINATVMDGEDFAHARLILITATGLCENTGMRWKDAEKSSVGADWGTAPSLVEGIDASISMPALKDAKAWALDARGQRKTEVPLHYDGDRMEIDLSSDHQTLWWEIAVP